MTPNDRAAIIALAYGVSHWVCEIGFALNGIAGEIDTFAESLAVESTEAAKECQTIPAPAEVVEDPDAWVADDQRRIDEWTNGHGLVPRVSER